jgi:hypothetical protein
VIDRKFSAPLAELDCFCDFIMTRWNFAVFRRFETANSATLVRNETRSQLARLNLKDDLARKALRAPVPANFPVQFPDHPINDGRTEGFAGRPICRGTAALPSSPG